MFSFVEPGHLQSVAREGVSSPRQTTTSLKPPRRPSSTVNIIPSPDVLVKRRPSRRSRSRSLSHGGFHRVTPEFGSSPPDEEEFDIALIEEENQTMSARLEELAKEAGDVFFHEEDSEPSPAALGISSPRLSSSLGSDATDSLGTQGTSFSADAGPIHIQRGFLESQRPTFPSTEQIEHLRASSMDIPSNNDELSTEKVVDRFRSKSMLSSMLKTNDGPPVSVFLHFGDAAVPVNQTSQDRSLFSFDLPSHHIHSVDASPSSASSVVSNSSSSGGSTPLRLSMRNKRQSSYSCVQLRAGPTMTVRDLIIDVLKECVKQSLRRPIVSDPDAFLIRLADDDGEIEEDLEGSFLRLSIEAEEEIETILSERSVTIRSNFFSTRKALHLCLAQILSNRFLIGNSLVSEIFVVVFGYVRVACVFFAIITKAKRTDIDHGKISERRRMFAPPDLLLKNLQDFVARRLDMDAASCRLYLWTSDKDFVSEPSSLFALQASSFPVPTDDAEDAPGKAIDVEMLDSLPKDFLELTMSRCPFTEFVLECSAVNSNMSSDLDVLHSVFLTEYDMSQYSEYDIIKINKYGHRQERTLGIDYDKIYNHTREKATSKSTKRPERLIREISDTYIVQGYPTCFVIEFGNSSLKKEDFLIYDCRSMKETVEIMTKLQYLVGVHSQQRMNNMNARGLPRKSPSDKILSILRR